MDVEDVDSARDYAALPDDAAEQQVQVAGTKLYANPEYQQPLTPVSLFF